MVGEIDTVDNPVPSHTYTGSFTADVDAGITGGAAPYVEYFLWDGTGSPVRYGTGWISPDFTATINPPANVNGWYQFTAKLYAYDDDPPYGPYLLDTVSFNIILDT